MVCWSSWWRVYGFSGGRPASGPGAGPSAENGRSASAAAVSICDVVHRRAAPPVSAAAYSAACSPARRPNTSRSERELPPSRLEPCIPPATSPAANRPGTPRAAAVSDSTAMPPIT